MEGSKRRGKEELLSVRNPYPSVFECIPHSVFCVVSL